jgi:ferredoxin-NADP reductase
MIHVDESSELSKMLISQPVDVSVTDESQPFLRLSSISSTFDMSFLEDFDVLVLLANGLGITPMIRIIQYFTDGDRASYLLDMHMVLLYFNEMKEDVVWLSEWSELNDTLHWFHPFLFVSHPDATWNEMQGSLSMSIVKDCLHSIPAIHSGLRIKAIASGDEDFLTACET